MAIFTAVLLGLMRALSAEYSQIDLHSNLKHIEHFAPLKRSYSDILIWAKCQVMPTSAIL